MLNINSKLNDLASSDVDDIIKLFNISKLFKLYNKVNDDSLFNITLLYFHMFKFIFVFNNTKHIKNKNKKCNLKLTLINLTNFINKTIK